MTSSSIRQTRLVDAPSPPTSRQVRRRRLERRDRQVARAAGGRDRPAARAATGSPAPRCSSNVAGYGRRPDDRPGRRRDGDPDPMPGLEPVAGVAQRHADLSTTPGHQRLGCSSDRAMGEVQDPGAHLGRRPVRGDVGQPHDGRRDRRRRPRGGGRPRARPGSRSARRAARSCRSARGSRPAGGRAPARSACRRRPTTAPPRVPTVGRCRYVSSPAATASAASSTESGPTSGSRPAVEPPRGRDDAPDAGNAGVARHRPGHATGNGSGSA